MLLIFNPFSFDGLFLESHDDEWTENKMDTNITQRHMLRNRRYILWLLYILTPIEVGWGEEALQSSHQEHTAGGGGRGGGGTARPQPILRHHGPAASPTSNLLKFLRQ